MRGTLIVSDLTYPPSQGLHEQAIGTIRFLADYCESLQVFIYCKDQQSLDRSALEKDLVGDPTITVIPYSGSYIRRGWTNFVFGKARKTERNIALAVEAFDPDFIHLDMAVAIGLHRTFRRIPGVISWIDPGSWRQFRFARSAKNVGRLRHLVAAILFYLFELFARSKNKIWHVVSPIDYRYLTRAHPGQQIVQIPVAVTNAADYHRVANAARPQANDQDNLQTTALIFLDLRYPHLYASFETLVKRCLLPLHAAGTCIRYLVLGRMPANDKLNSLCDGLDIEFVQWVDDLAGTLSDADFVILPDQVGTGLKTRSVHVLAAGCAVIGTPYAFEGIEVASGTHAVIVDSWPEWQEGIKRLSTDALFRHQLMLSSSSAAAPFDALTVLARWQDLYSSMDTGSMEPPL